MSTPVLVTIAFVLLVLCVYFTPHHDGRTKSLRDAFLSTIFLTGVAVMVCYVVYKIVGGKKLFRSDVSRKDKKGF